jgi:hypothetical protein
VRCRSRLGSVVAVSLLAVLAGCGGGDDPTGGIEPPRDVSKSEFARQLEDAQTVSASDFPAAKGRPLQELADTVASGPEVGLASSVFVPGTNRLAFGVIDSGGEFVYGKTAVYIAPTPADHARGPFPAPADTLITTGRYRSRTAASETDPIASIYESQVPFKREGEYAVLVVTRTGKGLVGAPTRITVSADSPIPAVGERPPAVDTDTFTSAGGDLESIDTRVPTARSLHEENFRDVLGKKPVALLFATPQLCQSRVCGPVVDIELQMQSAYGDTVAFIHQEVYEDNDVNKGLRAPLRAFNLQTEPWLFTFDRTGRVAARLEGSFGVRAFEKAIDASLQ